MPDPRKLQNKGTDNPIGTSSSPGAAGTPSSLVSPQNKPSQQKISDYPRLILIRMGIEFEQTSCVNDNSRGDFSYLCKNGKQYYFNHDKKTQHKVVNGYRAILRLELEETYSCDYYAIERANGYTHIGNPDGKEKTYTIKMVPRSHHKSNEELFIDGNIFIHRAEFPSFLDGCIAPGKTETPAGVSQSDQALKEIIKGLGGWEFGRKFKLIVKGYKTIHG